jgi:hypothetical protein
MHKLLSPGQTRWLSYGDCLRRLLEQWEVLLAFFKMEKEDTLCSQLENAVMIFTIRFLNYFMQKMNRANSLFQSESCTLHIMHMEMISLYKQILRFCLKASLFQMDDSVLLTPLYKIEDNLLSIQEIFLLLAQRLFERSDESVSSSITSISKEIAQKFLIKLCNCLLTYYPYQDALFKSLRILDYRSKDCCKFLGILLERFGYIFNREERLAMYDEYDEYISKNWRDDPILGEYFENNSIYVEKSHPVESFWGQLMRASQANKSRYNFLNISKFMCVIMSLPHSNADTERAFSCVTNIKTKKRNNLNVDTIEALLIVKSLFDNDYEKLELPDSVILFNDQVLD